MYHIPRDRRAERSAERIFGSLMACQGARGAADASVTEIAAGAGVGRSTFYRLFDNPTDVLLWKCDQVLGEALERAGGQGSMDEVFTTFIAAWLEQRKLLQALLRSNMADLLFEAHMGRMDEIERVFFEGETLEGAQREYLVTMLASMMATAFKLWERHPEPAPEEMLANFRGALYTLYVLFEG